MTWMAYQITKSQAWFCADLCTSFKNLPGYCLFVNTLVGHIGFSVKPHNTLQYNAIQYIIYDDRTVN